MPLCEIYLEANRRRFLFTNAPLPLPPSILDIVLFFKVFLWHALGSQNMLYVAVTIMMFTLPISQKLLERSPSKHFLISKTSWRRPEDMSCRHIEDVFNVTISCRPRLTLFCLDDVLKIFCLEDVLKPSWKTRNCYDLVKPFSN